MVLVLTTMLDLLPWKMFHQTAIMVPSITSHLRLQPPIAKSTAFTPSVSTQAVSSIATTTATGNGNITKLGIDNPTQYGVFGVNLRIQQLY